jgi:DNA-binding MarR family transcriptional regulator/ribosomal protein S18 acetylase RimI-like enzyme
MDAIAAVRGFSRFYTRFAGLLDAHYMESELSATEARILYEIANREATLAAELQSMLGLDAGYVSRILRRFQTQGWIERGRASDGRRRPIGLTPAGRAMFDALDARTREAVAASLSGLSEGDSATLAAALGAVQGLLGGEGAPWHIRTFGPGDLPLIASRQAILYQPYGWRMPMEILLGEVTTAFLRDFKPGREQCWIAERAGMMAGAVMLVDAGDGVGQLRLLHVEPWARGLGIGGALVGECVAFARAAGYATMRLWTHTILTSARRIYEAHGFRIVSTEMHHEFGEPVQGEIWELALKA